MAEPVVIDLDASDFIRGLQKLSPRVDRAKKKAQEEVGDELLRLSQKEVPKDTGYLEGTGTVERQGKEVVVGYNTPYAARLHEHPEYNFGKGRKAKYLEDPLKINTKVFAEYYVEEVKKALR